MVLTVELDVDEEETEDEDDGAEEERSGDVGKAIVETGSLMLWKEAALWSAIHGHRVVRSDVTNSLVLDGPRRRDGFLIIIGPLQRRLNQILVAFQIRLVAAVH